MPITLRSGLAGNAIQTQVFPVGLDPTKTFLVDQNRNPCFALGEDASDLAVMLNKSDVEQYGADRTSRGVNLIWLTAIDNIVQASPPQNVNGDVPFSGSDFTNFNEPYWAYLDYVMGRLLARGITALLMPVFVGTSAADGYFTTFKAASTATIGAYGTFFGNRYKGFPNKIYLLGGDSDPNDATVYTNINALAVAIKAADPSALMTMEAARHVEGTGALAPNGGYSSVDAHTIAYGSVQSWLDINWVYQDQASVLSGAQRCYSQGKPCLFGEDTYELDGPTNQGQRAQAYYAVLGGCTLGRLMGNAAIWNFTAPNSGDPAGATPWQGQLGSSGSVGQQLMGKLLRSRSHHLLVPDTSNSVMTSGAASGCVCASTSDGKTIIDYMPPSTSATLDMTKIIDAGGQANCNWFNVATGAVTPIGNVATSGSHTFTTPDANDYALLADSAAAGLRTPGT